MELLKVPSQQKRIAAAFVLRGIHISPSSKTPNCCYNQKSLNAFKLIIFEHKPLLLSKGPSRCKTQKPFFFFHYYYFVVFFSSTLHKAASSLSLPTVRFSDLSTFTPMKTVKEIRSSGEFRTEPNSVFAKEHFYMFSCDSASLTENSWSVPKEKKKAEK